LSAAVTSPHLSVHDGQVTEKLVEEGLLVERGLVLCVQLAQVAQLGLLVGGRVNKVRQRCAYVAAS